MIRVDDGLIGIWQLNTSGQIPTTTGPMTKEDFDNHVRLLEELWRRDAGWSENPPSLRPRIKTL